MLAKHQILLTFLNNDFQKASLEGLNAETRTQILSEANRHRIAPLLYSKIKHNRAESLFPADVLRQLHKKYLATAAKNMALFHQLDELLTRLNNKNIPVILLKGAHLAEFVYQDIAARPMSDLDILVKEEHLPETVQTAFDAGYRFFYDKNNAHEKNDANYHYDILKHYKHFQPLIHPETKCLLEIHCFITEVGGPFNIPASDLWQDARPAALNDNPVYLLSPEHLIIYLCLHAAYDHLFAFGLSTLYDIAITFEHHHQSIDWQKLITRSQTWGTLNCLMLSLYFTKKYLHANIPDFVLQNFQTSEMVDAAEERVFTKRELAPLHRHLFKWRSRRGWLAKTQFIKEILLPPREFMANRYIKPKNNRMILKSYFVRFGQTLKAISSIIKSYLFDASYTSRFNQGNTDYQLKQWLSMGR
ncbi:MAG: nucleotidyltransferase family protein [Desulfobacterales bacterium]|nr:nucleotidyltransferase family protein [Desulfobacterales bacterium]